MSRMTKMIGFSVTPAIAEEVERIAREEQRTKSELFRKMLSVYKAYRSELAQAEQERFERLIDQAVAQAAEEKERNPKPKEAILAELRTMANEIAERAEALGFEIDEDGDIVEKRA